MHAVAFVGRLSDGRFEGRLPGASTTATCSTRPRCAATSAAATCCGGGRRSGSPPADHAGALTLPREVVLDGGRLLARPVPELEALRTEPLPPGAAAPQMELTGGEGWLLADGGRRLRVAVEDDRLTVAVDDGAVEPRTLTAPLAPRPRHTLRVFADGSLVEVFADDGEAAITTRAYAAWSRVAPAAGVAWRLRDDVISASRSTRGP